MIDIIYRVVFVLLVFKLLMTMYQRKFYEAGSNKRLLSLYQSLLLGFMYIGMSAILAKGLSKNYVFGIILITVFIGFVFRKKIFAYKIKCEKCQKNLKINQILFIDSNICQKCEI